MRQAEAKDKQRHIDTNKIIWKETDTDKDGRTNRDTQRQTNTISDTQSRPRITRDAQSKQRDIGTNSDEAGVICWFIHPDPIHDTRSDPIRMRIRAGAGSDLGRALATCTLRTQRHTDQATTHGDKERAQQSDLIANSTRSDLRPDQTSLECKSVRALVPIRVVGRAHASQRHTDTSNDTWGQTVMNFIRFASQLNPIRSTTRSDLIKM